MIPSVNSALNCAGLLVFLFLYVYFTCLTVIRCCTRNTETRTFKTFKSPSVAKSTYYLIIALGVAYHCLLNQQ